MLILSALLGLTLANDAFLKFSREFGKQYAGKRDFSVRRDIFMKNYQEMQEHNTLYEAGEVSWARKVTPYYDLTQEEWAAAVGLGRTDSVNLTLTGTYLHFRHASV